MTDSTLTSCNGQFAQFDRAILVNADMSNSDWSGCCFDAADLRGANISNCNLVDASFERAVYDKSTIFSEGFVFEGTGLVRDE